MLGSAVNVIRTGCDDVEMERATVASSLKAGVRDLFGLSR